jgi:methyl-accepting chemotaxis protein
MLNKFFSNFGVRTQLFAGFGIILALMIITSTIAFQKMSGMSAQVEAIASESVGNLIVASDLQDANKQIGIAVRDLVGLESVSAQKESLKDLKLSQKRFRETLAEALKNANGGEADLLKKVDAAYKTIEPMLDDVFALVDEANYDSAKVYVHTKLRPKQIELSAVVGEYLKLQADHAKRATDESRSSYRSAATTLGFVLIVALVVGLALAMTVTHGIVEPLRRCAEFAREVACGDFTRRADASGRDEVSQLLGALNQMSDSLSKTVAQIRGEANRTAEYAQQLAGDADSAGQRSETQVGQVMSVTAAMEQMSVSIREVSSHAEGVSEAADLARSLSVEGSGKMNHNLQEVRQIVKQVEASGAVIAELSHAISQISAITTVIKEIADQTNLLALNAAIEAARAGEQGRGFAVVADEVRKLAERTAQSTSEIAGMLSRVEGKAAETVASMAAVKRTVESGAKDSEAVDGTLRQIVESAAKVSGLVTDIAAATQEQSKTTETTARSIEAISELTETTNQTIQRVKETAAEMNQVSRELQQLVGQFRINA